MQVEPSFKITDGPDSFKRRMTDKEPVINQISEQTSEDSEPTRVTNIVLSPPHKVPDGGSEGQPALMKKVTAFSYEEE